MYVKLFILKLITLFIFKNKDRFSHLGKFIHFVCDIEPNLDINIGIFVSIPRVEAYFRFLILLSYAPNTNANAAKVFDEVIFLFL